MHKAHLCFLALFFSGLFSPLSQLTAQNNELLGSYKIGFIGKNKDSAKYKAVYAGIQSAAKALGKSYSIEVETFDLSPRLNQANEDSSKLAELQAEAVIECYLKNIDGMILCPKENPRLSSILKLARFNAIEIVFLEEAIDSVTSLQRIESDEFKAGKLLGESLLNRLPTSGRVAILTTAKPSPIFEARLKGVKAALGYKRIETIVQTESNYASAVEALKKAESEDVNHYIKGWVFLDDWALRGLPDFPWQPKRIPTVTVQSSATSHLFYDLGYLHSMVSHPYYDWGYQASSTLIKKFFKGETPETPALKLAPLLVNQQTIEASKKRWKQWLQ